MSKEALKTEATTSAANEKVSSKFELLSPGVPRDDDLILVLVRTTPQDLARNFVPAYDFEMRHARTQETMGRISLRVGDDHNLTHYIGHIGYDVETEFRGRHYAARACRLLFPLARGHEMRELWITCNPDNLASARSIELAGGVWVETVDVPPDHPLRLRGETKKCRYRIAL